MVDIFIPKHKQSSKAHLPSNTSSSDSNHSEIEQIRTELHRMFPTVCLERLNGYDIDSLKAIRAEVIRRSVRKSLLESSPKWQSRKQDPYPSKEDIHVKIRTVKRIVRTRVKPAITSRDLALQKYAAKLAAKRKQEV